MPIPLIFYRVFLVGSGLILLAAITVKFRDIMHLYSVFVTALMYLTPVIYPMSILPEWLEKIVLLNPITNILMMFRDVMMNNTVAFVLHHILLAAVEVVAVMAALDLYVFYKRSGYIYLGYIGEAGNGKYGYYQCGSCIYAFSAGLGKEWTV